MNIYHQKIIQKYILTKQNIYDIIKKNLCLTCSKIDPKFKSQCNLDDLLDFTDEDNVQFHSWMKNVFSKLGYECEIFDLSFSNYIKIISE